MGYKGYKKCEGFYPGKFPSPDLGKEEEVIQFEYGNTNIKVLVQRTGFSKGFEEKVWRGTIRSGGTLKRQWSSNCTNFDLNRRKIVSVKGKNKRLNVFSHQGPKERRGREDVGYRWFRTFKSEVFKGRTGGVRSRVGKKGLFTLTKD